jgi:hypothetical protein
MPNQFANSLLTSGGSISDPFTLVTPDYPDGLLQIAAHKTNLGDWNNDFDGTSVIIDDGSLIVTVAAQENIILGSGSTTTTINGGYFECAQFNVLSQQGATFGGAIGSDQGNFDTDGEGNVTIGNARNGSLQLNNGSTLTVTGESSFDGGDVATDGNGNFSALNIRATSGIIRFTSNTGIYEVTVGGALFESDADVASTTSTSIQDLYSHTIPAGLLTTNKDKIRATFTVAIASTGGVTKTVGVSAFGTQIYTTGALTVATAGDLTLDVFLIRVSATSVRCVVTPSTFTTGTLTPSVTDVTGLTLTNTQILKITATIGTGAAVGNVTAKADFVEYLPYSGN